MKHLNQAIEKVYDVKVFLSSVYSEDEELIHHA